MRIYQIFLLAYLAAVALSGAAVRNDWTFDDAAGAQLPAVTNAGPENASFSGQTAGWATDGSGQLVANTATSYFRNAQIADVTAGQGWLRLETSAWNFGGTNGSEQIAISFRTETNAPVPNANIALIKIIRFSDTQVRLQVDDGVVTTLATFDAAGFSAGLDVIVGVNVDTDSYEVHYRSGSDAYTLGRTGVVNAAYTLDLIRLALQGDSSEVGEFWALDRLTQADSFADLVGPTVIASSNVVVSGLFELTFDSHAGNTYRLQSAANLVDGGSWTDTGPSIAGDDTSRKAYDTTATTNRQNYRVVIPLP